MGMLVEAQHLLLLHFCWVTSFTYFLPLLFSFWNFLLPIQKERKKKKLFFSLFVNTYYYISFNLSSFLFATLSLHYSLLYHYTSFIIFSLHTYIHTYIYIYIYIFEFSSHSFRYTQLSISLRPSLFSPYVY